MDDSWFHSFTGGGTKEKDKDRAGGHRRRTSLLQQPAEEKLTIDPEPIAEAVEEESLSGPPRATLARRAQSYSDFYDVVHSYVERAPALQRINSYDGQSLKLRHRGGAIEFEEQFAKEEDQLLEESHKTYQAYLENLQLSSSHLDGLLSSTSDTVALLAALSSSFRAVQNQTNAFRQQCESLIAEQKRLTALADGIEGNIRYYTYLEPITRRLNAPGAANLLKGGDFPDMLNNLDSCLTYMETHPTQSEAATYRSRYRLLLTRGLTLIRHHFTKSLGEIAADISRRIQGGQLKESTHSAMLYAKFRVSAPELKALGVEIQKRAAPTPDDVDAGREPEYASLMRELYQSYSTTRGRLILPLVSRKMAELAANPDQTDVLDFAKGSISFMRGICLDEYELWFEWFEREGHLYDFLESLMEPMFDYLRPRTIHETKLEKLCELCATIQGRYMDVESEDESDDGDTTVGSPMGNGRKPGRRLDFAALVQPALQDAQTRLVFLALGVLRDDIENYRPKPQDLEWPRKTKTNNSVKSGPVLSGTRSSAPLTPSSPVLKNRGGDDVDDNESIFSKHLQAEDRNASKQQWYPTLRKAIWLLRRIYRLVNSTVFDDLAHRVVHSTIHSLLHASAQVSSRKTPPDGHLFLIIHLLQLKQQIVAFDIEFIPPEVEFDFSSVTNTFYELRDRGSLWNPASWVRLVGSGFVPKVVENMLDAKAELDGRLRAVINEFVNRHAEHITAPIDPTAVARARKSGGGKDNGDGFDVSKAVRTVRGLAEKDVPALRAKLEEFVEDARTRETLVAAVRDQVVMTYEDFFDTQSEGTGRKLSRKGKGREDEVWGADLFEEAMEKVFRVGLQVGDDDGGDDNDGGKGGNVSE